MPDQSMRNRYFELLESYFHHQDEAYLAEASVLGQALLHAGVPPENITELHDTAIRRLAEKMPELRLLDTSERIGKLLAEVMMAYSLAFREQQARQEVEQNLILASEVVEHTQQGVMLTDAETNILKVNPAFCAITGYTPEEVIGKTPSILQSGHQNRDFYRQMWQAIEKDGHWEGKIWNRHKSGEVYPELLTVKKVTAADGGTTHYVGIFSDISIQTSLEEQLRQKQKMEAIGTLTSGIAHDFNNILAGIMGNLYLARMHAIEQSPIIEKIATSEQLGKRAADMIQQLLTFSRKGFIQLGDFSLRTFANEALKLARISVPENIQLHVDICPEPLYIHGDTAQIQQIIMNLLNNARDALYASEKPEIHVALSPYRSDDAFRQRHPDIHHQHFGLLRIRDNGQGIASLHLDKIFDPFFTTKEVGQGTGLGLSMVFGAMQTHQGVVEVESAENEYTEFRLYFPLTDPPKMHEAEEEHAGDTCAGNRETILIVDDETPVREMMRDVLEHLGYRVYEARDGQEAVEQFAQYRDEIHMVILDIVMPRMGGMEAARCIRAQHADIPIIFATGYDKQAMGKEGRLPRSSFLAKPYKIEMLSQIIRNMLHSS